MPHRTFQNLFDGVRYRYAKIKENDYIPSSAAAFEKLRLLSGGMAFIGRNSLLILCCHAFDMVVFSWEGVRQFLEGWCGVLAGTWMLLAARILAYIIVTGIILAVRKVCRRKSNMDAGKRFCFIK